MSIIQNGVHIYVTFAGASAPASIYGDRQI